MINSIRFILHIFHHIMHLAVGCNAFVFFFINTNNFPLFFFSEMGGHISEMTQNEAVDTSVFFFILFHLMVDMVLCTMMLSIHSQMVESYLYDDFFFTSCFLFNWQIVRLWREIFANHFYLSTGHRIKKTRSLTRNSYNGHVFGRAIWVQQTMFSVCFLFFFIIWRTNHRTK